ncbi:MAG: peptide ABC transporter substrate-binding protein [Bacillota bacterium]
MSRWIVGGAALLLGVALLLGCASPPANPVHKPAPVVRREARLHLPAEPATLDSARAVDPVSFDLLGVLMEGLVRRGDGGTVLPGVAERWESPDGRHFTFHLRRDARWSDGRQVTAGDFAYAWLRVLDPQHGSDYAFLLYEIEGAEAWNTLDPEAGDFGRLSTELIRQVKVTAADPHTLQVTLRAPNPNWVSYTAHPVFFPQRASVVAREAGRYGEPGPFTGNGPFQLERWEVGQELFLRKSLAYWDAAKVQLPGVSFRIEKDSKAALRLLEMGELDLVALPGEVAAGVQGARHMTQPSTMGLVFNAGRPYLANQSLRRAFHLAIDRKRLVAEVAPWSTTPSEGVIPPSVDSRGPRGERRISPQGNQLQARQLWELAREELAVSGVTLRLLHAEESAGIARALQTMLEENLAGLVIEREAVPFEERLERVRSGQFDLVLQGWTVDHDDPLSLLSLFVTDSPGNDPRWINREYDEFIASAYVGDPEGREGAIAAAERILLDQLPLLPLYHPVRHWIIRPNFRGVRHAPSGARLDLRDAYLDD